MQKLDARLVDLAVALLVGGGAFLLIVGWRVLDVGNILWLALGEDGFSHYIGWEFFRHSPWTWPPGLNPAYGLEFSSAIVFSDSVPLLPLILKAFSPLMPPVVQYTGWWILACFLLQAWFASRLAGLFSRDLLVKLALATLLVFAPPMLWRLSVHFSLIPHWIVLAAIYLYFAPPSRWRGAHWIMLLGLTALIHTYIFAMCLPIWLASLLRRALRREPIVPHWLIEIVAVFAVAALLLAVGGFFPLRGDMLGGGYGYFRLNLLSFVNPDGGLLQFEGGGDIPLRWPWSALLPTLPHAAGDYEGFNYAGLGSLVALALAFPLLFTERRFYVGHQIWPLIIACLLLTLFAISPYVTIGDRVFAVPTPPLLMDLASTMRSSGRFFWPVWYLLPLAAAWLLHKGFGSRVSGILLVLLAGLQMYDTAPGWSFLKSRFETVAGPYVTSIDAPEFAAIASHYNAVRKLPAANGSADWEQVAWFALRNGKPTDAAYLARPDVPAYAAYMDTIDATIAAHGLKDDSVYFLDREFAAKVAAHMTPDDALFEAGDFFLYAPGWSRFDTPTSLTPARP